MVNFYNVIMKRQNDLVHNVKDAVSQMLHSPLHDSHQDMIVFSHLRWEFVFQRPQHIISRFAKDRKVIVIEEPIEFTKANKDTAYVIKPHKNITVLQPRMLLEELPQKLPLLIKKYAEKDTFINPVFWFYSAMFSEVIPNAQHSMIVYDCMDELSAFKNASAELIEQERYLLSEADIVFSGGKSLYEEKKKYASNAFCFPSSVDHKHFAKAYKNKNAVPADIRNLPHPTAGFYGVIDERFDTGLLAQTAKQMPNVSFVMIGPVVKISQEDLPRLANIHYLGAKSYEELPDYLRAIDIAMMPFALNEATKFISPTKTLEFMAAGKPIVSTPITDVVRDYNKVLHIANTPESFAKAIKYYVHESPLKRQYREEQYKNILKKTSWDETVIQMKSIIKEGLIAKAQANKDMNYSYFPSLQRIATRR
jgi:glycosyltransferase involved in cell wall biosynthesis